MIFPHPDDLGRAPLWENYVVAQAAQASLGSIPANALAYGVRVSGLDIELQFQMLTVSASNTADMDDIVDDLQMLMGDDVHLSRRCDIRSERDISPRDGVCWVFLARR